MACEESAQTNLPDTLSGKDRTVKKKLRFLKALDERKSVSHARSAVNIARSTAYHWRSQDPAFADAWDDIMESAIDDLEASALSRAIYGTVTEKEFGPDGELIKEKRTWETALTIFLLKTRRRDPYNVRLGDTGHGVDEAKDMATRVREAMIAMDETWGGDPDEEDPPEEESEE